VSRGQFIGGAWVAGSGPELRSIDPATGQAVWADATAGPEQVAAAVQAARGAFEAWATAEEQDRLDVVLRYQAALRERASAFAQALSRETGKALWETTAELNSMVGKVDVSVRAWRERAGTREAATGFGRAVLRHKPHGVAAVLGPYNFPGHLPNGHIVPALLAGDTVVFKPSEETPWAGELMLEAWEAAGLPPGVVNLVQGGREVGQALLDQPIDALFFTGSAAAGDHFRRRFADNPHVLLALELGGNNPLVVWDAADAEAVASLAVMSAYVTTGQRCSCARRLVLPAGAAGDAVVEALATLSDRLVIGPFDGEPEPFMGPLISTRAAEAALQAGAGLVARGARELRPFRRRDDLGAAFVGPGLLDVAPMNDRPDEEIFAPLLQVVRVDSFEAAVAEANRTRFGLSAGLVSDDESLWRRFLALSRAGVVNWNRPTTGAAGDMPFGGLGASGNHRPSAYYAADYCAYPVASFEAPAARSVLGEMRGLR
jgi:succinylglutamic semialdehyde dehydrogenase